MRAVAVCQISLVTPACVPWCPAPGGSGEQAGRGFRCRWPWAQARGWLVVVLLFSSLAPGLDAQSSCGRCRPGTVLPALWVLTVCVANHPAWGSECQQTVLPTPWCPVSKLGLGSHLAGHMTALIPSRRTGQLPAGGTRGRPPLKAFLLTFPCYMLGQVPEQEPGVVYRLKRVLVTSVDKSQSCDDVTESQPCTLGVGTRVCLVRMSD